MKSVIGPIMDITDVTGVMVFNSQADKIAEAFHDPADRKQANQHNWKPFLQSLQGIIEADLLFERKRIYFKKGAGGCLLVLMESHAPAAMVRLSCEAVLAAIAPPKTLKSKARRWLKRKRP